MEAEEYLGRSRLYRRLRIRPYGRLVECYAVRVVEARLVRHGACRCLNVVGGLLSWIAGRRYKLVDLDEQVVERYLRDRGGRQSIQPGDRAALKRWLSVLREEGAIAPLVRFAELRSLFARPAAQRRPSANTICESRAKGVRANSRAAKQHVRVARMRIETGHCHPLMTLTPYSSRNVSP